MRIAGRVRLSWLSTDHSRGQCDGRRAARVQPGWQRPGTAGAFVFEGDFSSALSASGASEARVQEKKIEPVHIHLRRWVCAEEFFFLNASHEGLWQMIAAPGRKCSAKASGLRIVNGRLWQVRRLSLYACMQTPKHSSLSPNVRQVKSTCVNFTAIVWGLPRWGETTGSLRK